VDLDYENDDVFGEDATSSVSLPTTTFDKPRTQSLSALPKKKVDEAKCGPKKVGCYLLNNVKE